MRSHQPPEITAEMIKATIAELPPEFRKASFTPDEASQVLDMIACPVAVKTLAKIRSTRTDGPPHWKTNGYIRYDRDGLIRWGIERRGHLRTGTTK